MALRNKDSAMNKMSKCRTRNLAPVHSRRGRECDCEFRTNRTLMRPWAEFCGLPMIRDERKKKGTREKKESRERGAGLGWRKGKSPALDGEGMRGEPWSERTGSEC
ncbi:hypothetical protein TNCV_3651331 [Trichonephila clavipes]|nr:hypothetical protein TNCV_3651331 [Trichonephila clavipes]